VDSLFVLWRPDFKRYSVYIGSTVSVTTTTLSPDIGTGPQNVLTAGLSLQQFGLVSGLLRFYNAPGGLFLTVARANTLCSGCLAQLIATRPELTNVPIHELIQQFAAILYTPVWAAVSSPSNPVGTPLDPLDLDPVKAAAARDLTGSTNRLSMSYPCPEVYDPVRDAICFYESLTVNGQTLPKISFEDNGGLNACWSAAPEFRLCHDCLQDMVRSCMCTASSTLLSGCSQSSSSIVCC
jgi:hypothetical protein